MVNDQVMNTEQLTRLALFEIGQHLLLGDVPTDLADLLTEQQLLRVTAIRSQIAQQFLDQAKLDLDCSDWGNVLKVVQLDEAK